MTGATRSAETARALIRKTKRAPGAGSRPKRRCASCWKALRGEVSVAELCCRKGIHPTIYYKWLKIFLRREKPRLLSPEPWEEHWIHSGATQDRHTRRLPFCEASDL